MVYSLIGNTFGNNMTIDVQVLIIVVVSTEGRGWPADLYMCFTPDARGTEYSNSVPAGIEFQNDHECEARGIHFSLGPSA